MDPVLVISDCVAGDGETLERGLSILRAATSVEVVKAEGPSALDSILHRVGSRRLVVAGGDSSLHSVLAALHRRRQLGDVLLGFLPLGADNEFAREMGIPASVEDAAALVLGDVIREVDLIADELGGVAVRDIVLQAFDEDEDETSWRHRLDSVGVGDLTVGRLRRPIGELQATLIPPTLHVRVEVDGRVVQDLDHAVVTVEIVIAPGRDDEDGRLEVVVSRAVPPWARLAEVVPMPRRRKIGEDVVRRFGTTVSVAGTEFHCAADGESLGAERHRTWHIEPAAYSMLLP